MATLEVVRGVERHVLLIGASDADGAGVLAAMAGVEHDQRCGSSLPAVALGLQKAVMVAVLGRGPGDGRSQPARDQHGRAHTEPEQQAPLGHARVKLVGHGRNFRSTGRFLTRSIQIASFGLEKQCILVSFPLSGLTGAGLAEASVVRVGCATSASWKLLKH
jgi:hypothetical protein